MTKHKLPPESLLALYPRLERLFGPLLASIKSGSLSSFDAALAAGEIEFVKRRVYLTLERARDVVVRNVLRRTFLLGGLEGEKGRTRVPVMEFVVAVRVSLGQVGMDEEIEDDEVG